VMSDSDSRSGRVAHPLHLRGGAYFVCVVRIGAQFAFEPPNSEIMRQSEPVTSDVL